MVGYKTNAKTKIINVMLYLIIGTFSLLCFIPFLLMFSISITSEQAFSVSGYGIIPKVISFKSYEFLLRDAHVLISGYRVTTIVTVIGTIGGLLIMALMAYPMSRKDFKPRNFIAFYIFFTMLFSGGLVPSYILITKYLHLQDNILVLILPLLVNGYFVLLLRNFFSTIPDSFHESAKLDGANEFTILFKIILPLSLPALATVGLFVSIMYWNDWFTGLMYINSNNNIPLQLILVKILNNLDFMRQNSKLTMLTIEFPSQSVRMATCIFVIGPIILAYPLFQKYIIKGLMVGGIKG